MIIYLLLPFVPLLFQFLYGKSEAFKKHFNLCLFLSMLPMFFIIGFRAEYIGADTLVYNNHFKYVLDTGLTQAIANSRMEAGYVRFVKYIGYLTSSPELYQVIYTSIYFIGYYSFARLLDKDKAFMFVFFIITLGLFFFMLTGVRQNIAISICLFSVQFLFKRKYLIVALLLLLAFTFHKSALLFVFVVLMYDRKLTGLNLLIYVGILILVSSYLLVLQDWVNENFDYEYQIEETENGGIFLAIIAVMTFLSLIYYIKKGKSDKMVRFLFNANILTLFLWIIRLQTRVAERPSYYFLGLSCALFAYMYQYQKTNRTSGIFLRIGIFSLSYALFAYRLLTNFISIIPYKTFFQV